MNKRHEKNCECPICNNEIREELQYGALKIKDDVAVILDAMEMAHINKAYENSNRKQPEYPRIEPEENSKPMLVYGVLIPQCDSKEKEWVKRVDEHRNYAFGTLDDEKVYVSAYSDYELFTDEVVYNNHIPCALLLDTALDLYEEHEYGFGHTALVLYKNMGIIDNILNREFLFCLGGVENSFSVEDTEHWKKYINKENLMSIAKRLF